MAINSFLREELVNIIRENVTDPDREPMPVRVHVDIWDHWNWEFGLRTDQSDAGSFVKVAKQLMSAGTAVLGMARSNPENAVYPTADLLRAAEFCLRWSEAFHRAESQREATS